MITRKTVWVTDDDKEFDSVTQAENYTKCKNIASKIQGLLVEQNVDIHDLAPYDIGLWIAENAVQVVHIINEGIQYVEEVVDENELIDENSKTQEFRAVRPHASI